MKHLTFDEIKKGINGQLSMVNCQNGFTLPEILVGLAVFGLISILVAGIYFAQFRLFANQNTSIEIANQARTALDEIVNQVRQSQQVAASCCDGETTSSTTLILAIWSTNETGEPYQPSPSIFDYIVYKQDETDNTKLTKKTVPDSASSRNASTQIIATKLAPAGLQFSYDNKDPSAASEVTVNITTQGASGTKTHTITQSAKAILRNK